MADRSRATLWTLRVFTVLLVAASVVVAAVGVQLAAQEAKEGGFAAAVGARQADLPARMQLQRCTGDQRLAVAGKTQIA